MNITTKNSRILNLQQYPVSMAPCYNISGKSWRLPNN